MYRNECVTVLSDFTKEACGDHSSSSGRGWVWVFSVKSTKAQFSVSQHFLCITRCLFLWLMTQEGPSILLLLCCTFSPPPPISPNPAACLLRGLCMKSHCHVQGRAAQGQLIAFMIMISRQIYRACSEHIFLVLPTLLAWMGKMSLQLLAVTSCLSAGHTFWLTRVEHRGWITLSFPVKATVFYASNCTCFAHICPQKSIFNTLTWTYTLVWRSWQRNDTDRDFGFSAVWTFFIFFFMSHKSFNFVSVSSWNR